MFYTVTSSTDQRQPNTKIKKFTSEKQAVAHAKRLSGGFTHLDPAAANNYHRNFSKVFELKGRVDRRDPIFKDNGSRDYPKGENEQLHNYLCKFARRVEI